ncbi:bifunctional 3'-5' exonuclease/DNA polymerase [Luethyella okanaganae]|uniref:DNA-directed DNA polymerase n=1 Tax=Luethyella okanaganae TaxID=69372 RepID=A0ABW1VFR0_9MICO
MYIIVARSSSTTVTITEFGDDSLCFESEGVVTTMAEADFAAFVAERETEAPRWVWDDTARWYARLLDAGVRVQRCHDLRLCHSILRHSELTAATSFARAEPSRWDAPIVADTVPPRHSTLFDLSGTEEQAVDDSLEEFGRQRAALAESADSGRLRLLLAAESVGALTAAEMRRAGLPWRSDVHDELLAELLGPRVLHGTRPRRLEELVALIRGALDDPRVNPDSQQDLLRSLTRTGLMVASTRAWELREIEHPVIEPLLEYKKLSRLLSANGWAWMDAWIVDGRFHPDYVPGGVVTGRWATSGGGALQLPKQVRAAVRPDPGWKLVVADAAQLEPRVLAGMAADTVMAAAGRGTDLYAGIVASGVVETRDHAKVAMLGAMYGATTGESGRLLPRLARAYPRAIHLVEAAARAGERGESVSTRLGRSSPRPGGRWQEVQSRASQPGASGSEEAKARSQARDWGRFTRNFVVQGSAAEWALCWMGELRKALTALGSTGGSAANASGPVFARVPHLVFFLHDEVIVHTPTEFADAVAEAVVESANAAGRLLFGEFPVDFPLGVAIVDSYADAK